MEKNRHPLDEELSMHTNASAVCQYWADLDGLEVGLHNVFGSPLKKLQIFNPSQNNAVKIM